jgi:hypothetical protein
VVRLARFAQLVLVLLGLARVGPVGRARPSVSTLCTRSSVERSTRDTSDVTMIVAMNQAAILTPSGRSITLATVV